MRVNSSVPATVARTSETPATAKSAVSTKVSADPKPVVGHSIVDGGCFPTPHPLPQPLPLPHPLPIPLPPIFKGADAKVRADQGKQLHEIANDVRNGSVTAKESEALLKEQQEIAKATKDAMADGKLSVAEQLKLNVMQARAELHIYQASHNGSREVFARFDSSAQREAGQIDRIANGRTSGNVTNSEATELLGQEAQVSEARTHSGGLFGNLALESKLNKADQEIAYHSKPGTQLHLQPFPHPLPQPLPFPHPLPMPMPHPLPFPELPRPLPMPEFPRAKPSFEVPVFLKGNIAG